MSTRCARPPRCSGPSDDTPPAPRLGWQLWALRPGLDGASRPSTTLTGRRPTAGFGDGALDRNRLGPPVPAVHDISAARGGPRLPGRAPARSRRRDVAVGVGGGANSRGRRGVPFGLPFPSMYSCEHDVTDRDLEQPFRADGRKLTKERRYAPTSVHVRRIPRSRSPDLAFNFTGMRNEGGTRPERGSQVKHVPGTRRPKRTWMVSVRFQAEGLGLGPGGSVG